MGPTSLAQPALSWLSNNEAPDGGVVVTSLKTVAYPEVTGYWIPTLIAEGETTWALSFARFLVAIQRPDGAFFDPDGIEPYAFDTGQVIRGLAKALPLDPTLEGPLRAACDWMIATATSAGRLQCPESEAAWDLHDRGRVNEGIHLYALPGLCDAAEVLDEKRYRNFAIKSRDHYIERGKLIDFRRPEMLTHFFCYIQEGLIDLGAEDLARQGMSMLAEYQAANGAVPAYHDVNWICCPGAFQAAICWHKLGDSKRARQAYNFITKFENASGGYFGSTGPGANYFPAEEPSWVPKFALDAERILARPAPTPDASLRVSTPNSKAPRVGDTTKTKRLVVVSNDPMHAYEDAGYPDQTQYFNPEGYFDEVYALAWHEPRPREIWGMKVEPTRPADFATRVEQLEADCVRAYCLYAGRYAAARLPKGIPLICSVHDTDPTRFADGVPDADLFLAMSAAVEDRLIEYGARPERIERLPNRVNTEIFHPIDDDEGRTQFAKRFPGRFRVLHVGRKTEQKNIETTLRALNDLGDDYVGIFVGKGDDTNYQKLAADLGIGHRCHWIESVDNHELPRWYSFADCFCVPSLWEGFGIVFIEAMACGAAVVTSAIRPMSEFVVDGVSGLLVQDLKDPVELAEKVKLACTVDVVRERISMGGIAAAQAFDKKVVDRKETNYYRKALTRMSTRAPISFSRPEPVELTRRVTGELQIERLSPSNAMDWEDIAHQSPDAQFFHSIDAQRVFEDGWPSDTLSFVLRDSVGPLAICPLQRWRHSPRHAHSSIMGTGGPAMHAGLTPPDRSLAENAIYDALDAMLQSPELDALSINISATAPQTRPQWRQGQNPLVARGFRDHSTLTTVIHLEREIEEIWKDLHSSYRRDIRRAQKRGLQFRRAEATSRDLDEYYSLHVETYRRTGVEPHPKTYFEAIFKHLIASGRAEIVFAEFDGSVIGATNTARFRDASLYWTGAYSKAGLELDAAKILQWEAIKQSRERGLRYHETGEVFPKANSAQKEAGLTLFKRRFGGDIVPFFKGTKQGRAQS